MLGMLPPLLPVECQSHSEFLLTIFIRNSYGQLPVARRREIAPSALLQFP
jgi:hypothetical protein